MRIWLSILLCLLVGLAVASATPAQDLSAPDGEVIVPESSREAPADVGRKAHTNHLILRLRREATVGPAGMVPDEARAAYGLPSYTSGDVAGSQTIAIVDAYDYPSAEADFDAFAEAFGLPRDPGDGSVFQVVYAKGTRPAYNSGWSQEAALDIEWAHAMAPTAKIVLVEAASNSFTNLLQAVDVAETLSNVREISMSWGGSEFAGETSYDSRLTASNVVYLASSGDSGGKTIWPGVSPNAVSAGGTTLNLDSAGNFLSETGWKGSGGGLSRYEGRPHYQDAIASILGGHRGAPDLSFDANPYTGVSVYWQGGWLVFGGTSVSAPSLAGILNLTATAAGGTFAASTAEELSLIYTNLGDSSPSPGVGSDFRDIISGSAGRYRCKPSWDFVTGVGSNWGLDGK